MIDDLRFAAPFGPLGWIAERLFLAPYLTGFLVERNRVVKELAEGEGRSRIIGYEKPLHPA